MRLVLDLRPWPGWPPTAAGCLPTGGVGARMLQLSPADVFASFSHASHTPEPRHHTEEQPECIFPEEPVQPWTRHSQQTDTLLRHGHLASRPEHSPRPADLLPTLGCKYCPHCRNGETCVRKPQTTRHRRPVCGTLARLGRTRECVT